MRVLVIAAVVFCVGCGPRARSEFHETISTTSGGRHTVRTLPQEVWSVGDWRERTVSNRINATPSLGLVNVATTSSTIPTVVCEGRGGMFRTSPQQAQKDHLQCQETP